MLQFATGGNRQGMGLLNHHDDPIREYAYDNRSAVGRLDKGLTMAGKWGWQVVSMKNDWKYIFRDNTFYFFLRRVDRLCGLFLIFHFRHLTRESRNSF